MNSPDIQDRNLLMTIPEQPQTPRVHFFDKSLSSKSILLPDSPTIKAIETTLHTSTPVAAYKLAQQSMLTTHGDMTLSSTIPFTSQTPANSDSTINYRHVLDMSTSQVLNSVHTSTKVRQPDQMEERALSPVIMPKAGTTSHSSTMNQSVRSMQSTFLYPGSIILKYSNSSRAEISSCGKTDLATATRHLEDASVFNIKESPPNSQGSVVIKSEHANDPDAKSTKLKQLPLVYYTSRDSITGRACDEQSTTPDLKVVDSKQAVSVTPVLFDAPGCLDGAQSLANKVLQFQLSHLHQSQDVEDNGEYDHDKTPPISPEDETDKKPTASCEVKQNDRDVDSTTDQSKKKEHEATSLTCAKLESNAENSKDSIVAPGKKCVVTSKTKLKKNDTALGQPRTKRVNTRMASRKSMAGSGSCGSIWNKTPSKASAQKDDDFVHSKRTPRKQVTVESQVYVIHLIVATTIYCK